MINVLLGGVFYWWCGRAVRASHACGDVAHAGVTCFSSSATASSYFSARFARAAGGYHVWLYALTGSWAW